MFDDLDGKFQARLRDHRISAKTSRTREGEVMLLSTEAILEVRFDLDVLDRLHEPCFAAIERPTTDGKTYLVYEVVGVKPMHFQMLGMDVAMPTVIRREYLETIHSSWEGSDETWIDVIAVPTRYRMDLTEDGEPVFSRSELVPLIGSPARLLSSYAVRKFLCRDGGAVAGTLLGFNMPLTIDMESLVRYHTGVFGFTGSGKSNLTSYLLRQAWRAIPDLRVVILDIAGEYAIHLADILLESGVFYSTENYEEDVERFLNSQTVPETLEDKLGNDKLEQIARALFRQDKIKLLTKESRGRGIFTIEHILQVLQSIWSEGKSGKTQALMIMNHIQNKLLNDNRYSENTPLHELSERDLAILADVLREAKNTVNDRSSLYGEVSALLNYIEKIDEMAPSRGGSERKVMTPEGLAQYVLSGEAEQLVICYLPEPDTARLATSRFIDSLLLLKKTRGARRKVLVVLDEAHEYIPDRAKDADYSASSNKSVEALLRQGRKYRAHCWLATQRVAHLNVNALQQLHSYFVSTLPRFYDRMVIADAFSLSYGVVERTTELDTGEWLFVSYKATKQKNVPVFLKTPNNEELLLQSLSHVL
ncbi:MAG: DUF87 domain-containing protein [Aigarchaeota archaeon]|nr:DUF87 domain-containing protein [Candidatus Pelearchaeum maunauluense]